MADVDDTAKGIISLEELGYSVVPERMIKEFESETHFRTYSLERDPSFTANTNALLALLHRQDASRFSSQIVKAAEFLCKYWWDSDNEIRDKWVSSPKILEILHVLRVEYGRRTRAIFIHQCLLSRLS